MEIIGDFPEGGVFHHKGGVAVKGEFPGSLGEAAGSRNYVISWAGGKRQRKKEGQRYGNDSHFYYCCIVSRMVSMTPSR